MQNARWWTATFCFLSTWNSWRLQWWFLHSFCLHIAEGGCHKTWSDTDRSSRRPPDHHCCRAAIVPTVQTRHWWSGFSAWKAHIGDMNGPVKKLYRKCHLVFIHFLLNYKLNLYLGHLDIETCKMVVVSNRSCNICTAVL